MLKFEKGNIVTGNYPVFCQQVNCKGVMGAGLAKQIRSKYHAVYTEYAELCGEHESKDLLGHNQYVYDLGLNDRVCVNMFAQDGYGRDKRYTDYSAFKSCLDSLAEKLEDLHVESVAFPYGIGCGLAGGDWYIVLGMLKDFANKIKQDVIIVSLE
jgi:O-acetyl-ADP-ribose deacetylase (regulator of RNase III)